MSEITVSQLAINNFTYRRYTFGCFLESAKRLGIQNIELSGCHPHFTVYEAPEFDVKGLAKQIADAGIKVPVILPEQNFLPINIASHDDYLRQQSVKQMAFYIEAAPAFGCDKVTLYPGKSLINYPRSVFWANARNSIRELCAIGKKHGVTVLLEGVSGFISDMMTTSELVARMLEEVGADNLGVCVNSSAASAAGETLEDYFARFGSKIGVVQLSDSVEDNEQLVPGEGDQDFAVHFKTLESRGFTGPVVLELLEEEMAETPEDHYKNALSYVSKYVKGVK